MKKKRRFTEGRLGGLDVADRREIAWIMRRSVRLCRAATTVTWPETARRLATKGARLAMIAITMAEARVRLG